MWAVTNQTRFKANRAFARDTDGAEVWIVAVRATFDIGLDGQTSPSKEQLEVCLAPTYFGEPGKSSLRFEMDLLRTKPGTDVVINAHAHAPGGLPTESADVGFTVGSVSKTLRVVGNRVWSQSALGLVPGDPEPFVMMPITYETALGGPLGLEETAPRDAFNPAGIGRIAEPGQRVPNVEYPDNPVRSPKHKGLPAGFGAIPCNWLPRVNLAGTYDEIWQRERQPLVPKDFQDAYFSCAPADQQISSFLQGGEQVVLRNLTRDGLLRFALPRITLGFRTRIDGGTTEHRGKLHTVLVEPEDKRLIMVWQTALPCHHTLYTLKETVVFEKERVPLGLHSTHEVEVAV